MPIGYVQATVECRDGGLEADLAWVIQPTSQGLGLATEAVKGMADWLTTVGVGRFAALVHPELRASSSVARNLGLRPTDVIEDGEVRWEMNQ